MKYKSVNHWKDIKSQEGLLLFAQIIDECLFDYALSSFKPPALNTRLLCIELLQTIDNVNKGLIKEPNLKCIIDELRWSLSHDIAAHKILGKNLVRFNENIGKFESRPKELKTTILLLYHYFDNRKYLTAIGELLIEKINGKREKKDIYYLTKALITELTNYGYNQNFIYYTTSHYFFNNQNKVNIDDPTDFLSKFDFKKRKFTVTFKGSKVFKEFEKTAKSMNILLMDSLKPLSKNPEEKEFIESKTENDVFIICTEVEAFDIVSARINSEYPLQGLGAFFSFYHHKDRPILSDTCIVKAEGEPPILLDKSLKSIIKKEDINPRVAAQKVQNLFQNLNLPNSTIYTVSRAIDLHSAALEANDLENKLLNLWTAFETLIPKNVASGTDRIVQLTSAITPFQLNDYFRSLINETKKDFWFYDRKLSDSVIKNVVINQKESLNTKVAAFLTTEENEDNRKKAYAGLDLFPLLRFRIFQLNCNLKNGKAASELLNTHKQKVEWQIRRIYRARNLIVHSGKLPTYTNILVENLHNYFDSFLETFINKAISERKIRTIDQGILELDFQVRNHFETLEKNKDNTTNLDNFKSILFDE
jgi:hypothetical protein